MAVGKEAPIPNVCIAAAECRQALAATVAAFTETVASLSPTTVKRRLKDAVIVMPKGFAHEDFVKAVAAPDFEIECKVEVENITPKL